jgi:hypothetical protein
MKAGATNLVLVVPKKTVYFSKIQPFWKKMALLRCAVTKANVTGKLTRKNSLNAFPRKLVFPSHVGIAMEILASAGKRHVRISAH